MFSSDINSTPPSKPVVPDSCCSIFLVLKFRRLINDYYVRRVQFLNTVSDVSNGFYTGRLRNAPYNRVHVDDLAVHVRAKTRRLLSRRSHSRTSVKSPVHVNITVPEHRGYFASRCISYPFGDRHSHERYFSVHYFPVHHFPVQALLSLVIHTPEDSVFKRYGGTLLCVFETRRDCNESASVFETACLQHGVSDSMVFAARTVYRANTLHSQSRYSSEL